MYLDKYKYIKKVIYIIYFTTGLIEILNKIIYLQPDHILINSQHNRI